MVIQLEFESYFIKLISIQGHISLHSSVPCVAPKLQEAFMP